MDKDTILGNAKNNLQLFEKAQTELTNAKKSLTQTKEEINTAIDELISMRSSIDDILNEQNNEDTESNDPKPRISGNEDKVDPETVESESEKKEEVKSEPKKTRAQSSKKKKPEPETKIDDEVIEAHLLKDFDEAENKLFDDDIDSIEF